MQLDKRINLPKPILNALIAFHMDAINESVAKNPPDCFADLELEFPELLTDELCLKAGYDGKNDFLENIGKLLDQNLKAHQIPC